MTIEDRYRNNPKVSPIRFKRDAENPWSWDAEYSLCTYEFLRLQLGVEIDDRRIVEMFNDGEVFPIGPFWVLIVDYDVTIDKVLVKRLQE